LPSARHQFTLRDHGYKASALQGVPVYVTAFASTHCAYRRKDGQAETLRRLSTDLKLLRVEQRGLSG